MSTTTHSINLTATTHRAVYGIVGGLAGGVVLGLLMAMMDMIGMVAQLVGSSSAAVGWVVHISVSVGGSSPSST